MNALPEISVRWRYKGEVQPRNEWIKSVAWLWSYPYEYNLVASPMIRVEVSLPKGTRTSDKIEFAPNMATPLKFVKTQEGTSVITDISLFSPGANIDFELHHEHAVLEIRVLPSRKISYIEVHPSCAELGLTVDVLSKLNLKENIHPIAITCLRTTDGINLNILHWAGDHVFSSLGNVRQGRFRHIVEFQDRQLSAMDSLRSMVKVCENPKLCTTLILKSKESSQMPNWSFDVAPTLSRITYTQQNTSFKNTEFAAGIDLRIRRSFFDQHSNIQAGLLTTLAPLSSTAGGNEKANFYHFNVDLDRVVYETEFSKTSAAIGFVMESMQTVGTGWGYDGLEGPSLGLQWSRIHTIHSWGVSAKFGWIKDDHSGLQNKNFVAILSGKVLLLRLAKGDSTLSLVPAYRALHFESVSGTVDSSEMSLGLDFGF